jgi:branched-chain amino acid transport system permease protein
MVMLGGTQTFFGPIVGAVLFRLIEYFVLIYTEYHGLVFGIVILVIVLGLRQGVSDYLVDWLRRRKDEKLEFKKDTSGAKNVNISKNKAH